jgi:hypothetical protein
MIQSFNENNMTSKLTDSLHSSLHAEKEAIEKRFSKADNLLTQKESQRISLPPSIQADNIIKIRRDGFSMTEEDYQLVLNIIHKFLSVGINPKRSEIYRLAIHALSQKSAQELAKEFKKLNILKPGRK